MIELSDRQKEKNPYSGRVLGLDVGTVRVGLATSDTSTQIAFPRGAFNRAQGEAEREILKLMEQEEIGLVVAGLPLFPDGARSPMCDSVERFCRRLLKRHKAELHFINEAYSSVEAETVIQNPSRADRASGRVDSAAACCILERYFQNLRSGSRDG